MDRIPSSVGIKGVEAISAIAPLPALFVSAREEANVLTGLVKGQVYTATVLGQQANNEVKVNLNGKPLTLTMQPAMQPGATLLLKYVGDAAQGQFRLLTSTTGTEGQVSISHTAREVSSLVDAAKAQGTAQVYQAYLPATRNPLQPQVMAQDLKFALESSGLFYESHLADFAEGSRLLNSLKMEPQNQAGPLPSHLLAQQLHVLETQRMHWSGEVWPGQLADWQLAVTDQSSPSQDAAPGVVSHLTLELPCLGTIQARLTLTGDRLQVTLVSDDPASADTLQKNAQALVLALKRHIPATDAVLIKQPVNPQQGVRDA